jgi:hypothetical protein
MPKKFARFEQDITCTCIPIYEWKRLSCGKNATNKFIKEELQIKIATEKAGLQYVN